MLKNFDNFLTSKWGKYIGFLAGSVLAINYWQAEFLCLGKDFYDPIDQFFAFVESLSIWMAIYQWITTTSFKNKTK